MLEMIKSFTNKFKTFVFSDRTGDNNVTEGRKRKRDTSEGDEEEDVIVTSVKRARKVGPHTTALNYFNTLIVNPYQKMAEWVQRRKPWAEHYFFRKKAPNINEAPNRDPGIVQSTAEVHPGNPVTDGNQPVMTKHAGRTDGFKLPREGVKLTGNGHQSRNVTVGAPEGAVRWTDDRHASNPTSHPAPLRSTTDSHTVPSLSQSNHTSTSVQTDQSDLLHRVSECDVVRLSRHDSDKSLFSRPPRKIFTALECVRLDEKKKYQQLLQQFTQFPRERSSHSPDGLGASHLLHYGSRTEGSLSGSNSSLELCSVGRQSSVRRQKVVPTQKTRIPTPPRNTDYELQRSPLQHSAVSPRQSLVSERWDSISLSRDKSDGEDDVICLDDEEHDERGEDVICILDDELPVGNGRTPLRPPLDSSRLSDSRPINVSGHRSPDFQTSKYLSEDWMWNLERQFSRANREAQRKIEETEIKKKFYEEKHLKKDLLLERQVRQRLRLYDAEPAAVEDLEPEEEEEEEEAFPELTEEMVQVVNDALRPQPADEVLVEGYKLQIRRRDMESLAGLNWLNDEIINFYMNQLVERGEAEGKPKVYAFNTFFYPKVMSQGHSSVKRWTRRVDIFSKDYILIPVHLGMHWCLAVIDFKKKMIRYFDSMGGNNMACLNALKEYLCAESLDKKKQKFDLTDWKTKIVKDIPQQMNGSDCGMFTCKFAEYITREADINFTQEHMPYFRKRMVYEIVKKKLLQ